MSSYGDDLFAKEVVASGDVNAAKVEATGEVKGATVESTNHIKCAVYANTDARDNAIPTPAVGMLCVLVQALQFYDGTNWRNVTLGSGGA